MAFKAILSHPTSTLQYKIYLCFTLYGNTFCRIFVKILNFKNMSKEKSPAKESKKEPTKTLKEKREAKKEKKDKKKF